MFKRRFTNASCFFQTNFPASPVGWKTSTVRNQGWKNLSLKKEQTEPGDVSCCWSVMKPAAAAAERDNADDDDDADDDHWNL